MTPTERTAAIRARMGAARITRAQVARLLDYHVGYVEAVLADRAATKDLGPTLDRIEAAVDQVIEANARKSLAA